MLTVFNVINLIKKKPIAEKLIDAATIILGLSFSLLLFYSWEAKDYIEPLKSNDSFKFHTPIAPKYALTFIILMLIALIGYSVLRINKNKLPPLISLLCISAIYIGIVLGIIFIIQLSKNMFPPNSSFLTEEFYMVLFPLNYMLCSARLLRQVIKLQTQHQNESNIAYKSKFMQFCQKFLLKSIGWYTTAFVLMIPLLGVVMIIMILFGQSADAAIKAFTETSDWTLSQRVSPPPIYVQRDDHYLCTVAVGGHKQLVKPTRMGIRHGKKIVVNRQLCVANAFEQVIEEKTPRFHKFIRYIYDKYGYPLSKHITTSWRADIVYIIMKPLEWLFVFVLYLCDLNPESRIAMQYTGKLYNGSCKK